MIQGGDRTRVSLLFLLVGGCGQPGGAPAKASADAPGSAPPATSAPSAAPPPSPPPSAAASASGGVPSAIAARAKELGSLVPKGWDVPKEPSKPPTVKEWAAAAEYEVRNAKSLGCETKFVREWIRVSCRSNDDTVGTVTGMKWLKPDPRPSDYFDFFKEDQVASVVLPIRVDVDVQVEFSWMVKRDERKFSRTLTISWKKGSPSPAVLFSGKGLVDMSLPSCAGLCPMLVYFNGSVPPQCAPHYRFNPESGQCYCTLEPKVTCADDW